MLNTVSITTIALTEIFNTDETKPHYVKSISNVFLQIHQKEFRKCL